jgi:hypothetical protein
VKQSSNAEHLSEYLVLLAEVRDDVLLLARHPANIASTKCLIVPRFSGQPR